MNSSPVIFFGAGAFGVPTLAALVAQQRVLAIVTQPDKPAGRGGTLTATPIAAWAQQHAPAIHIFKPIKCNTPEVRDAIRAVPTNTWVVIAFGQKLGQALLADRFAINLHASLLPRWRGAAPINAAMVAGDTRTGNSVITLADRMDAGLVLATSERTIDPLLTAGELHDALSSDGPALIERVLTLHATNALQPRAQDESLVTIAPKMSKPDGWVNFSLAAMRCRERIHGLTPWPGVSVLLASTQNSLPADAISIKLLRVQEVAVTHAHAPGTLFDVHQGLVACGLQQDSSSALKLLEVQPAGKKPMPWADFARGRAQLLASQTITLQSEQPVPQIAGGAS